MSKRACVTILGVSCVLLLSYAAIRTSDTNGYLVHLKEGSTTTDVSIVQNHTAQQEIQKHSRYCKETLLNTNSTWFHDKVNFDIIPLWTEETIGVNKDVYKWWMTIQRRKEDDLIDAMNELFRAGVPRHSHIRWSNDGCTTCAVVGSSNNLLEHTYGELIDNHTHVLRFNGAITAGYEKHVGAKLTHLFLYPESKVAKVEHDASVILVPFKPPDLRWLASALGGKPYKFSSYNAAPPRIDCDVSKILILHPHFMRYVHFDWMEKKGVQPSLGFLGIIFALHHCDKVDLFGFGADSKGRWLHYYDKSGGGHASHDDSAEKRVIALLENDKIITFYH